MAKTINMECPICKKKVLFVGVHDDEGNYHGLVGCEYENDPWSGLSYALHHEGWGDCPLCTDGAECTMGGMLFDTAAEAISALSQPNDPLTLEQLREMDGEPVYIIASDMGIAEWNVIAGKVWMTVAYDVPHNGFKTVEEGIRFFNGRAFRFDSYGTSWIAYRRPPEGEEEVTQHDVL